MSNEVNEEKRKPRTGLYGLLLAAGLGLTSIFGSAPVMAQVDPVAVETAIEEERANFMASIEANDQIKVYTEDEKIDAYKELIKAYTTPKLFDLFPEDIEKSFEAQAEILDAQERDKTVIMTVPGMYVTKVVDENGNEKIVIDPENDNKEIMATPSDVTLTCVINAYKGDEEKYGEGLNQDFNDAYYIIARINGEDMIVKEMNGKIRYYTADGNEYEMGLSQYVVVENSIDPGAINAIAQQNAHTDDKFTYGMDIVVFGKEASLLESEKGNVVKE